MSFKNTLFFTETLRKWPIGIATDRVCTKPYTIEPANSEEKPVHLSVGDIVWVPICGLLADPKYFTNPEKFDPERFNEENKQDINPYAFLPFGVGPRNCIASRFALLECKIIFFYLLTNFELVPVKRTLIPMKLSKSSVELRAEGGNWLGFKRITK